MVSMTWPLHTSPTYTQPPTCVCYFLCVLLPNQVTFLPNLQPLHMSFFFTENLTPKSLAPFVYMQFKYYLPGVLPDHLSKTPFVSFWAYIIMCNYFLYLSAFYKVTHLTRKFYDYREMSVFSDVNFLWQKCRVDYSTCTSWFFVFFFHFETIGQCFRKRVPYSCMIFDEKVVLRSDNASKCHTLYVPFEGSWCTLKY